MCARCVSLSTTALASRASGTISEPRTRRQLARVVGRYARTELVALDELGYLALPDAAAELVFQVLHGEPCPRHGRPRSTK
jgi:hypothetical protein